MKINISRGVILSLCVLCYLFTQAQDRIITGAILDRDSIPLSNATVSVKGKNVYVATSQDGSFNIPVSSADQHLLVSYVGMRTAEISIAGRSNIVVVLDVSESRLNEVVVVGYGSRKRADITSSISSISEKDIKNLPVSGIDQAIQGKLAGVMVNNNGGQPGGGVSVRVRGITSINGNEPLYVVDGVPILTDRNSISHDQLGGMGGQTVQSPLATLNTSDIVSVDILKDASAQAIYGSLAANGVVMITTKRGKAGDGQISYETYYGWQNVPKKLEVMDLREFAQYNNEVLKEIADVNGSTYFPIGEYQNIDVLGKGTDWQDAIFRTGNIKNHQLSFSGGADKTNYYFSLNYFDQSGTIIGSGFNRYSLRFNIDHQIKSWFKVGMSTTASRSKQRITLTNGSDAVVNLAVANSPAAPVFKGSEYAGPVSVGGWNFGNAVNPVALAELRDVQNVNSKVFGNVYGELQLTDFLNYRSEVNFSGNVDENTAFQPYLANILTPSRLREEKNLSTYWGVRNFINFNKNFGSHHVNVTVGHEAQGSSWDNLNAGRMNLNQNLRSINAGAAEGQQVGGGRGDWNMESYFARAGYSYNDRYAVNFSIRRDGSSAFGPDNRIGYFPAASIGWTISNESFAAAWQGLTYLKLRAGAGAVGNQNVGGNAYVTNIRLFSTSPFGAGGIPQNVGNPLIKWESVITYNIGLDFGLLNGKIDVSVDAYKKETTDMLMATELPVYTGIGTNWDDIQSPIVNAGKMTNQGIDLSITSYNINKADFNWKTQLALSHYKNELVNLNSESAHLTTYTEYGNAVMLTRTIPGGPVGRFYGFVYDGLYRTNDDLNKGPNQGLPVNPTGTWLGDIRYKDLNGDGIIDSRDITFIGNPNPDFTFGLTNTFTYKAIDLSIFLQGSYGNQILNYTRRTTEALNNVYWNQLTTVKDRYTAENTNGNVHRYNQWHQNNMRVSDRMIEDGSYLRIQNISIGYNLPVKWISRAKLTAFRIYASGQNIHTFTKYTGFDPELGSFNSNVLITNVDLGNYPNPRTFTIGANISF